MRVKWSMKPSGTGWQGVVEIPVNPARVTGGGVIKAKAHGKTKAEALSKAGVIADQIVSNPVVAALLPPQATVAVKAIKAISKGAAVGKLKEVASSFTGPAVKRLSSALKGLF